MLLGRLWIKKNAIPDLKKIAEKQYGYLFKAQIEQYGALCRIKSLLGNDIEEVEKGFYILKPVHQKFKDHNTYMRQLFLLGAIQKITGIPFYLTFLSGLYMHITVSKELFQNSKTDELSTIFFTGQRKARENLLSFIQESSYFKAHLGGRVAFRYLLLDGTTMVSSTPVRNIQVMPFEYILMEIAYAYKNKELSLENVALIVQSAIMQCVLYPGLFEESPVKIKKAVHELLRNVNQIIDHEKPVKLDIQLCLTSTA